MNNNSTKPILVRITTVPISMNHIMRGQLGFMNQFFHVIGISSYVKKDVDDIVNREKIDWITVNMKRNIAPISDFFALIKLVKIFIKIKPHIVHSHTPKAGLLGMLAATIAGVPIRLHTVAGMPLMDKSGMMLGLLKEMEKLTYLCAKRIYPNSFGLMNFIQTQQLCDAAKLKVIASGSSNGINVSYFNAIHTDIAKIRSDYRADLNIPAQNTVFLFLGRLATAKGIQELVEAFIKINELHASATLLLVGPLEQDNGKLNQELIDKITNQPSIIYPGRAEDIRLPMAASDIFVFPSYREGFPGVLLQAGAMGLPVIASNINGNNELIEHGYNGLLVDAKNSDSLLDAMVLYLQNETLRKQHAMVLQSNVRNNYNNELIWTALLNEYRQFLKE